MEGARMGRRGYTAGVYITGNVAIGQLYRSADTTLALTANTYKKLVKFTNAPNYIKTTQTDSTITATWPGYYTVSVNANLTHASDTAIVELGVYKGDTLQSQIIAKTEIRVGTKYETIAGSGLIYLSAGDIVSLRVRANKTGDLTISGINFYLKRE